MDPARGKMGGQHPSRGGLSPISQETDMSQIAEDDKLVAALEHWLDDQTPSQ